MPTPSEHARSILRWLDGRTLDQVESGLRDISVAPQLLQAAAAIGDAADSENEAERDQALKTLFAELVEPLNDSFRPAGRALYARLFPHIIWRSVLRSPQIAARLHALGVRSEEALLIRYWQARSGVLPLPSEPIRKILVLSRVTIGADILLTSVALQRLREKYPQAEIVLAGDNKLSGLFAGMSGLRVAPLSYQRRGPLRDRLGSWVALGEVADREKPDLVLGPDSRLDQLGILPLVGDRRRYVLWENLQGDGQPASLSVLFDEWLRKRFHLDRKTQTSPRLFFDVSTSAMALKWRSVLGKAPTVAVKFDHGGNPAKALPRAAEVSILKTLHERGWRILLDRGYGNDELANSDALLTAMGVSACDVVEGKDPIGTPLADFQAGSLGQKPLVRFYGSIAGWAAAASCCDLAISYDSVGHHLAAALGVPVVVAFTGYSDPSFPIAWQPRGVGKISVVAIPSESKNQEREWQRLIAALPAKPVR